MGKEMAGTSGISFPWRISLYSCHGWEAVKMDEMLFPQSFDCDDSNESYDISIKDFCQGYGVNVVEVVSFNAWMYDSLSLLSSTRNLVKSSEFLGAWVWGWMTNRRWCLGLWMSSFSYQLVVFRITIPVASHWQIVPWDVDSTMAKFPAWWDPKAPSQSHYLVIWHSIAEKERITLSFHLEDWWRFAILGHSNNIESKWFEEFAEVGKEWGR